MEDYTISTLTSLEELVAIRAYWEREQWHPAADYAFYTHILKSRAESLSPYVLQVSQRGEPVALLAARLEDATLPLRFGYARLGAIRVRRLVIIGGGFMGMRTEAVWRRLLEHLSAVLSVETLDLAVLAEIRLDSFQHTLLLQSFGRSRICPAQGTAEHWQLRLPQTWGDFMAARSKKRRYWLNRLPKVLDRDFPQAWSIVRYASVDEAPAFAVAAEQVARITYHRSLGVGFQDNEETRRRLQLDAERGQLRGYVLFLNHEPQAFWYCFEYGNTLYLASTGYDPAHRHYELGTVLLLRVFQDATEAGVAWVDFGLGDADYKQRFGNEHFLEANFLLFPKTLRGLGLNVLLSFLRIANRIAKAGLDRLRLTQRLKTFWRRRKVGTLTSPPKPDQESAVAAVTREEEDSGAA
jgi:hypothetical protein